ncbi:hypothetical protein [Streptomyces virginiae]|uniref:Uncharacterized protein n=1 Tax=Streptomyces virginiae TaxID=1961 RepID=A0ABZ1TFJ6_STRVG|nr:hypothetical protein [Streptomyces virginiae]
MTMHAYFVGGSRDGETQPLDVPETRTIITGRADGTAEAYVSTETTRLLDGVPHVVYELRR